MWSFKLFLCINWFQVFFKMCQKSTKNEKLIFWLFYAFNNNNLSCFLCKWHCFMYNNFRYFHLDISDYCGKRVKLWLFINCSSGRYMLTKWPVLEGNSSQRPSCCICNFTAVSESMYKNPFPVSPYVSPHSWKEGNAA